MLHTAGGIGAAGVPILLMLVGAGLYPPPRIRHKAALGYLTVVRLVAIPLITVALLLMLKLPPEARNIALVVSVMPASVSSVILTRRYGGDPEFAAEAVLATTLFSILTVPTILGVFLHGP
ncbi:MAG: AEC family transporter [Verrucomicrobia bacterium]|nr:AEC family transporter [Verrucomicrobiota bacterium]